MVTLLGCQKIEQETKQGPFKVEHVCYLYIFSFLLPIKYFFLHALLSKPEVIWRSNIRGDYFIIDGLEDITPLQSSSLQAKGKQGKLRYCDNNKTKKVSLGLQLGEEQNLPCFKSERKM